MGHVNYVVDLLQKSYARVEDKDKVERKKECGDDPIK